MSRTDPLTPQTLASRLGNWRSWRKPWAARRRRGVSEEVGDGILNLVFIAGAARADSHQAGPALCPACRLTAGRCRSGAPLFRVQRADPSAEKVSPGLVSGPCAHFDEDQALFVMEAPPQSHHPARPGHGGPH